MRQAARGKAEARASLLETQLAACTAASDQLTQRAAESELLQASLVQSNASCHDTAAALRATVQAQLAAARDGAGLRAL